MKKFISFHKIPQFNDVIRNVIHQAQFIGLDDNNDPIYDVNAEKPTVTFFGTVKLHGTNGSVVTDGNEIWAQSRRRIVTPESDNYDFSQFVLAREEIFKKLLQEASKYTIEKDAIVSIFGEYCGQGIANGVAISQLKEKIFVIFTIKITIGDDAWYIKPIGLRDNENQIYNIYDFPTFLVDVDFNYPEVAQNKFVELVNQVENECPVGKALGISGIGEGIVWTGYYKDAMYTMKTKGDKHSATKVKKVASVNIEKVESIREFVDYAVTESRLQQGVEELFTSQGITPSIRETGDFLRWVMHDIAEEEIDTLLENGLVLKDVGKFVSNKARPWFQTLLNRNVGLK